MSAVNRSHLINNLGFQLLKGTNTAECVSFSPLAVLANVNFVLQSTGSDSVAEQIGHLVHFTPEEKNAKKTDKVKLISDLIHSVVKGEPEFVTINLVNGVCSPSNVDIEKSTALNDLVICKDAEAVSAANMKIGEGSSGKLKNVVNAPQRGLTLFSTMYLKAPFLNVCFPENTQTMDFHVSAKETVPIPMLKYGSMLSYGEDKDVGVRMMMNSFNGCNYEIVVMVPTNKFGLAEMEKKLSAETFEKLIKNKRTVLGSINFPKIRFDKTTDLKSSMEKAGLKSIFDAAALSFKNVAVEKVTHGVSVDLNEFGSNQPERQLTEREMMGCCLGGFVTPPEQQDVVADQPFLFAVIYSKDNSLVFLSRVVNPTKI